MSSKIPEGDTLASADAVSHSEVPTGGTTRLSVVIPAHNEAAALAATVAAVVDTVSSCVEEWEIVIVDDGSKDGTFDVIRKLAASDARMRGVRLSRNFGKEAALLCGLQCARGSAVVTMDADLQHPPESIPEMVDLWKAGAKVVNGVKRDRTADSRRARTRARLFNRILSRLAGIDLKDASDFKLLDRVVVDALVQDFPERLRFYRGLAGWVGYPSATVEYAVGRRGEGGTRWSVLRLAELAMTALVSFTSAPLRIVTILGVVTMAFGLVVGLDAVISYFRGKAVSGFATVIITLLIIGSFIMISLGVLGEYVAKIYDEIKQRPAYLVQETIGGEGDSPPRDDGSNASA